MVGLLSFVNFFGFEKSILALGTAQVVLVVTVILLNLERIPRLIEAFRALSDGQ